MSVKVKVSYTDEQELAGVIRLLAPAVQRCKVPRLQEGKYKRAYIELQVEEKQRTPDKAWTNSEGSMNEQREKHGNER